MGTRDRARELVEALLPGKASWPKGSWQSVAFLLGSSIALTFRTELTANFIGLIFILASGAFLVYASLTQPGMGKVHERRVRYRVFASILLTLSVLLFASIATAIHVLEAREIRAVQAKRLATREQLSVFLGEGRALMEKTIEATNHYPMEEPPRVEANAWTEKVRSYLRKNMDESAVGRFDNPPHVNLTPIYPHVAHNAVYQSAQDRVEQLRLFIAELKD